MAEATWTSEELYLLADRGYGFYQQGRYEEAAVIFDGLIALDAGNSYYRTALAAICLALGDAQRAVDELSAVLEKTPADLEARARRCEAYCELRRWAEARRDLAVLQRNGERNHARRLAWRLQTQSGSA
ncbi:MAG TPA: tetratricopeptide repeat protein [Candidatus Sulfotelmatobacter sp.]|jgi:predicted Zn-dependent protease|nr:tetratricopeptide repeat protein [Candidatus Sulfotelmatobacter sp.]